VLDSKKTVWTRVVVAQWYNAQQRTLLTATGTALWYKAGVMPVPIRWVLVRDPTGEHEPAAFLSTDLKATPAMIPRVKPEGRLCAPPRHRSACSP